MTDFCQCGPGTQDAYFLLQGVPACGNCRLLIEIEIEFESQFELDTDIDDEIEIDDDADSELEESEILAIATPKHLDRFLQPGEVVLHASEWTVFEIWTSSYYETYYEEYGSTTIPVTNERQKYVKELVVFTNSRLFFLRYGQMFKTLKHWDWMTYDSVTTLYVKPERKRNGKIRNHTLHLQAPRIDKVIVSKESELRAFEKIFAKYAGYEFHWYI
jgi:hypothetical protein